MKKTTKTIMATIMLMTVLSFSAFADGNMQCPNSAAPCLVGNSDVNTKPTIKDESNESDTLSVLIAKMFHKLGLLF